MASKSIKAGEAFLELAIKDGNFRRSIDNSISKLNRLGDSFKRIGSLGISGGGLGGLRRALELIAGSAALTWPIRLAAELEVAQAAFTALTGSADKARDILTGLQEFSGQSSFNFSTLQGAARNMLNFGVAAEQVLPLMQQLGAIAAGDSDRLDRLAIAFGQTQAKGRLMAEEVRQMVNAGFNPLQEIARTTGRSMKDLISDMEKGGISAEQVANSFATVTGPGGRFAGILKLIQDTATGQFRKLAAAIRVAVIPLGNELLPAITGVLKYVNNLVPSLAELIKQNAGWYKVIIFTTLGLSGLLAALFSTGVAMQVVAFAAGGLLTIFSVLTSPIVLVGAALAGLATLFVKFTNVGSQAFGFLAERFGELGEIAKLTFEGISDAIAGGSLPAAANVAWAGLALAWIKGTSDITLIWIDYKFFFLQNTTELVLGALSIWHYFATELKSIWASLVTDSRTIGEQIGHALTRSDDPELAADQDAAHQQALGIIAAEGEARQVEIQEILAAELQSIAAQRRAAGEDRDAQLDSDIFWAEERQSEAQAAFDAARKAAREARPKEGKFGGGFQAGLLGDIGGVGAGGLGPRSTFSAKLASQVFGAAGDDTGKKLLVQAQNQNKNLVLVRQALDGMRRGFFLPVGGN